MIDQRNTYNADKLANPNNNWGNDTKKDQSPGKENENKDAPFTPTFPQPTDPEIAQPQADKNSGLM